MDNYSVNSNADKLGDNLNAKIKYLNSLRNALFANDDLEIYRLINVKRYNEIMKPTHPIDNKYDISLMIEDLQDDLSHYLCEKLISYLGKKYPFLYYYEYRFGHFRIYFGNWWDHKLFGELDVLNVKFDFDPDELNKLSKSFELEAENKTFYSDTINDITNDSQRVQSLIDAQPQRDARKEELKIALQKNESKSTMPWEIGRVKQEHKRLADEYRKIVSIDEQANNGLQLIKSNEAKILELNKEDMIISYEKQSIRDSFQNFQKFIDMQSHLYFDYLNYLADNKDEVKKDE
ncbi:hypothetical protein [Nicoliella lavandulae]|uniref:Exonuclease SbcC n=1 Tax=Nicoliella lavandulae TaxID=3082954 RepID=A0ABU8SLC1_9LACO